MRKKLLHIILIVAVLVAAVSCHKETEVKPADNPARKSTGVSARDILSNEKYTAVNFEIQYMPGFKPDDDAVNNLRTFLNALVSKPGGISISFRQIAPSGKTALDLNEIVEIENRNRTAVANGSVLGIYLLFADADYAKNSGNSKVLGMAYYNTSMVVFGKTQHDNAGTDLVRLETIVMEHEFGHIMGLVNIGSPMQVEHRDAANGNHCNNKNCLMYYATETTDILGLILGPSIPPLDANCKADLKANGGK